MEKRWLIKINEENNLYYDSEKKIYRLRLFCVHCHKPYDCRCYKDYEDYEYDKSSGLPSSCCSYFCCLSTSPSGETDYIKKVVQNLGMNVKPLAEYTEEEAEQIIDYIVEKSIFDLDEDSAGERCSS
jgi:hypothetical protein